MCNTLHHIYKLFHTVVIDDLDLCSVGCYSNNTIASGFLRDLQYQMKYLKRLSNEIIINSNRGIHGRLSSWERHLYFLFMQVRQSYDMAWRGMKKSQSTQAQTKLGHVNSHTFCCTIIGHHFDHKIKISMFLGGLHSDCDTSVSLSYHVHG